MALSPVIFEQPLDESVPFEFRGGLLATRTVTARPDLGVAAVSILRCASGIFRRHWTPFVAIDTFDADGCALLNRCAVLAVVRNPVERVVSIYRRICDSVKNGGDCAVITKSLPFWGMPESARRVLQFIRDVDRAGLYEPHLNPQVWFLTIPADVDVWFLCKDGLADAVNGVLRERGVHVLLGRAPLNISPDRRSNAAACAAIRKDGSSMAILRRLYHSDFALYKDVCSVARNK